MRAAVDGGTHLIERTQHLAMAQAAHEPTEQDEAIQHPGNERLMSSDEFHGPPFYIVVPHDMARARIAGCDKTAQDDGSCQQEIWQTHRAAGFASGGVLRSHRRLGVLPEKFSHAKSRYSANS